MSAPMVRALIAGTKVQDRRIVKRHKAFDGWHPNGGDAPIGPNDAYGVECENGEAFFLVAGDQGYTDAVPCPYGKPGDRLWVRETWQEAFRQTETNNGCVYLADYGHVNHLIGYEEAKRAWGWKRSIHMPRWASRLTLEITDVRVQKLQEISEEDAKAEGLERTGGGRYWLGHDLHAALGTRKVYGMATHAYRSLWESINGQGSWEANPYVWKIVFRKVKR